tara:strand:+ start:2483 stop:2728 length:246 start_codon:yes stop_codon:yes gene_type:complete
MEMGNVETAEKLVKRTVKVTKTQTEECKKLLRLMGVPVVEAPCEGNDAKVRSCRGGVRILSFYAFIFSFDMISGIKNISPA